MTIDDGDGAQREHNEAWAAVAHRATKGAYDELTAEERAWYCVRSLLDSIERDGLRGYFSGSGADHFADCKEGLRVVGGGAMPTLLSLIGKLFPFGVPGDVDGRRAVIESWPRDGSIEQILDPVEEQAKREAPFVARKLALFVEERILGS